MNDYEHAFGVNILLSLYTYNFKRMKEWKENGVVTEEMYETLLTHEKNHMDSEIQKRVDSVEDEYSKEKIWMTYEQFFGSWTSDVMNTYELKTVKAQVN